MNPGQAVSYRPSAVSRKMPRFIGCAENDKHVAGNLSADFAFRAPFRELLSNDCDCFVGDRDVVDADPLTLANRAGMSNPTWQDGDFDATGVIDMTDLDVALSQFGRRGLLVNSMA
jgi:hypothetical protein